MTLSDLWPTFQGHDNNQRTITRLIVSRVWSDQWFCFQWPWVTLNVDFKVTDMPSTNCVRSWRAICSRELSSCSKFLMFAAEQESKQVAFKALITAPTGLNSAQLVQLSQVLRFWTLAVCPEWSHRQTQSDHSLKLNSTGSWVELSPERRCDQGL